jgi:autotransporter-associated beta strand protein
MTGYPLAGGGTFQMGGAIAALGLTLVLLAQPAAAQLVGFSGNSSPFTFGSYPYTIGYDFTVGSTPVTINALGVEDTDSTSTMSGFTGFGDGLSESHVVGLWQGGSLIASATVSAGTSATLVNDFRYAMLSSPITLTPGTTYDIGAYFDNGTPHDYYYGNAGWVATPGITLNYIAYNNGGVFSDPTNSGGSGGYWAGANATLLSSPLVWTGSYSTAWDTSTQNWTNTLTGSASSYSDTFGVLFDDTAGSAHTTVDISSGNVAPLSVTFNNSTTNFILQGSNGISGPTGLAMTGSGMVTIGNSNAYTGATTISSGTLQANNAQALGSGGNITFGGGTLQYTSASAGQDWSTRFKNSTAGPITLDTNSQNVTLAGIIDGSNTDGLTKAGSGTLTLAAANAYSGATTLSGGTLNLGAAENPGTSGPLGTSTAPGSIILNGGCLQYSTSNQYDYSPRFSTAANQAYNVDTNGQNVTWAAALTSSGGSLQKLGAGMLTLTANNTYTGPTVVSGGTLAPAVNINYNAVGTINANSAVSINNGGTIFLSGADNTLGGYTDSNIPPVTINTGGAMVINAAYTTHLAILTLAGGTLGSTGAPAGDGSTYGTYNLDMGLTAGGIPQTSTISALDVGLTQAGGTVFTVNPGAANGIDLLVTGYFGQPGGVGNTAFVKAGAGVMALAGANTYTAGTTISGGTLMIGNGGTAGSLSPASAITDNAALAFNLNATAAQGSSFSGSAISGTGSLVQMGPGTTILNVANSYSGGTIVNGGTLALNAAGAIADNTALTINSGGYVSLTYPINAINGLQSVAINSGGTLSADSTAGQAHTLLNSTGTLSMNGGVLTGNANFNGTYGQFFINNSGPGGAVIHATGTNASTISAVLGTEGYLPVNVDGGATLLVSGTLATVGGAGYEPLVKTGNGILFLLANNSVTVLNGVPSGYAWPGVTLNAGQVVFANGGLGFTSTTPASKTGNYTGPAGTYTAEFSGNSTLTWAPGNNQDISANGNLKIDDGVTATLDTGCNNVTLGTSIVTGPAATGGLTKAGSGTLTLSAANSYSGGTTVNCGVLAAGAANALSPGSAHYAGNNGTAGTLDVTAGVQTVSALTIGSLGTLNISAANPLTVSGSATFVPGSTIDISGAGSIGSLPYALMTYSGLPSGTFTNVFGLPASDALTYSSGSLDIVSVNSSTLSLSASSVVLRATQGYSNTAPVTLSESSGSYAAGFASASTGAATVSPSSGTLAAGGNMTLNLGWGSYASTGPQSGSVVLSNTANAGDPFNASGNTISMTGAVVTNRVVTASPIDLGVQHAGASLTGVGGVTNLSSGSGDDDLYTRVTVAGITFNGTISSGTANVTGNVGYVASSGSLAILTTTGEGLPGESPINVLVGYTATAFSGNGVWNGTSGSWGSMSSANWVGGAAPGTFAGFANTDTATFSGSGGVTNIDLSTASPGPSLMTVNFSTANYTLNNGTLTLNSSTGTATANVLNGSHIVNSAVYLAGGSLLDVIVSNSGSLTINGNISDDGLGESLQLGGDGSGQLVLGGSNSYSGGTIVNAGTLVVESASALPDGSSLTVGAGASALFGSAVAGPAIVATPAGVVPVPEPGTLVLLFAALGSIVAVGAFRMAAGVRRFI